ncbi:family 16 glycosylhydrolase [Thaumasiovibrio sp. DFM-14]|uniref:family 16 glycosylhydrolase n=1 Tax=Thaumasiovibrio sp. DFM-14 TaxID=3384792 RepID=UPI0039A2AA73
MHPLTLPTLLLVTLPLAVSAQPPAGKGKNSKVETENSFFDPLTTFDTIRWQAADGWANHSPFLNAWSAEALQFDNNGMTINLTDTPLLNYDYTSGELRTSGFYGYGCYEVEMKPAAVSGVVSAFFTFMGPYDNPPGGNGMHNEIDIEFLGKDVNSVQFNFWTNDDLYNNGHETIVKLGFDAAESFNHYAFSWSETEINWYVNKQLVLSVFDSQQDPLPKVTDGAHKIMLNTWPVDSSASEWAGPFTYPGHTVEGHFRNVKFSKDSTCQFNLTPTTTPTLHLSDFSVALNNRRATQAVAIVEVSDENNQLMQNVTVRGIWSGAISSGDNEKQTDSTGSAEFYSHRSKNPNGFYEFCITELFIEGYNWSMADNSQVCSRVDIP